MNIPAWTENDLTCWIIKNRMMFLFNSKQYTPDHVCYLARTVGFDAEMVYRRFSNFKHALALTSIEREAHKRINWGIIEMQAISNPIRLTDSWDALGKQLLWGIDFMEDYPHGHLGR